MLDDVLNYAIRNDILDLTVLRRMYEMAKKEEYLKKHRFKVYQGKDGRWFTYPCSRDYFYDRYRKFFWILDGVRDFIPTYSGK
jgi:hypothetical protein